MISSPAVLLEKPLRDYPGIDPLLGAFTVPLSLSPTPIEWSWWDGNRARGAAQRKYMKNLIEEALRSPQILPDGIHRITRVEIR
jgi:hypothetical protein